jgi:CheY-like chemotaxis protein
MFYRVLIAVPEAARSQAARAVFARYGFVTTTASTFRQALNELERARPDLLAISIRLGAFNGLHLALRCRAMYPDLPVMVLGREYDSLKDIEPFNARFVPPSTSPDAVVSTAFDLLGGRQPQPWTAPMLGVVPQSKPRRAGLECFH